MSLFMNSAGARPGLSSHSGTQPAPGASLVGGVSKVAANNDDRVTTLCGEAVKAKLTVGNTAKENAENESFIVVSQNVSDS